MTIQQQLKWVPALLLAAAALPCAAQRPADYKKSGDFYYTSGNYYSAAVYYQQYLTGGKGSSGNAGFHPYAINLAKGGKGGSSAAAGESEIQYRLAESYRRIYNYSQAAAAYEQLLKGKDAAAYPEARYGYALALRASGKPAEARAQLEQYLQGNGANKAAAQLELQSLAFAEREMSDPKASEYTIARMADPLNGAETNYAAQWSGSNLVFTSTRPDTTVKGNQYANRIYTGTATGGVQAIAIPNNDAADQGAASMSPDGTRLYFTRWTYDRGVPVSSIYMSHNVGNTWSNPVKFTSINPEGSSAKHPFVTPDGKYLLFASNRPDGLGGFDIWAAPINGDNLGAPQNLGGTVNTSADDEAPFYHAPSGTLVFASRGRVGMGGLDLYSATGNVSGGFAAAQNMGYPVNSNKDDSYFSTGSADRLLKGAVISSDRGNDACMSLYSVDKQYRQFVSGKVVDCGAQGPIAGARVQLDGRSATTAQDGSYTIEVAAFANTNVAATMEGYEPGQQAIGKPAADMDTLMSPVICLKAIAPPDTSATVAEAPARDNTVLFEFAKYSLRPETQVTLDTLAAVLKREGSLRVVVTGYTDQVGSDEYNLKLSRERAQACADYLQRKGIPASRIQVVAKGACCPVQPEKTADGQDDPAARQQNRRVEFDIKLTR